MKHWLERAVWLGCGVFLGGAWTHAAATTEPDTIYRKLSVLAEVIGHIENHYVDAVSPVELIYGAARGAVGILDDHSTFFSPDEYKNLVDVTEGEYAGIGVELDLQDGFPLVLAVLDGSPAGKAGVVRGDKIIGIDGKPTEDMAADAIYRALRGPVGTKVVLTIDRPQAARPWAFTIVRNWIRMSPLEHRDLAGGVHYVQLKGFPRRVASDLDAMLDRVEPTKGLILDLRNNPGGLFDEAVEICDLFLAGGLIVSATGSRGQVVEKRMARDTADQPDYPLAILIDGGSASAAEVVAGALADRGRARLFGSRSYGKGSVQSIVDLSDGSGLKLTVARYLTPSGRQIDQAGIEPDEVCAPPSNGRDEAFAAAIAYVRR